MDLQGFLVRPSLTLIILLVTSGCVGSNGHLESVKEHPALDYEMTGIPLVVFGFGTSTPLTPQLSLTVAHVAKINYDKVVAYHPYCDIAIVESNNDALEYPELGVIYPRQAVQTFGMSPTGDVLSGSGVYHRDLMLVDTSYFQKCPASITDAPVQDGMSGGGVYSSRGTLVGIISARADPDNIRLMNGEEHGIERISIFVALNYVRDWLEEEVSNYYNNELYSLKWESAPVSNQLLAQSE